MILPVSPFMKATAVKIKKKMGANPTQNLNYPQPPPGPHSGPPPQVYRRLSKTPQDSTYASAPTLSLKINQKGWPLC